MVTKKKSASFTGTPKTAPKAKAPRKTRGPSLPYEDRVAKANATFQKLQARHEGAIARMLKLQKLVDEGPKLPKAKDATSLALTKSEKKTAKLMEQLAKEKETMDRLRAEKELGPDS
jgi:hypothetical protein